MGYPDILVKNILDASLKVGSDFIKLLLDPIKI